MESNKSFAQILSVDSKTFNAREELAKVSNDSQRLYVALPDEATVSILDEALTSKRYNIVLVERPVTGDYFEIQRLAHQEQEAKSTQVFVNYALRRAAEVQELRQKVDAAIGAGNQILSVAVQQIQQGVSAIDTQSIDLVLYLVGENPSTVQGFSGENNTVVSLINGTLVSGASFSVQARSQTTGDNTTAVQVTLSNGEVLSAVVKTLPSIDSIEFPVDGNRNHALATLQDAIRVTRVVITAQQSLRERRIVLLKYPSEKVVAARTIGTAKFLDVGFFIPTAKNDLVAITGVYSNKQDQIRAIFNRIAAQGEPLEFQATYKHLLNHGIRGNPTPIFYTPSIPGERKDNEILDALAAGYIVLAEKPAFANSDLGKAFLPKVNPETKSRLFFGWHYQHHYVFKKLLAEVQKNTFGKIKHIRTHFVVPILLANSRIFDPSQGGAGIDIYSYCLHFTLRLLGFEHSFEVTHSKIQSAQDLDPSNPKLSKIDYTLDSKISFGNGVTAEIFSSFDATTVMHSEGEILFEDGTRILTKEFVHPQNIIDLGFTPTIIRRPGSPKWEDYITEEDKNHREYVRSTYDQQVEFVRRQATGEDKYDLVKDENGIGIEANIKLQEIIDDVFQKGGFEKKPGA